MNIVKKLIHETVALVASIIISVAICGVLFGVSTIFDPNGAFFWVQLGYAGFMALVMILMLYISWDDGMPKVLHEIEITISFISLMAVLLLMIFVIMTIFGNIFLTPKHSISFIYSIPPIIVVTFIIGIVAHKLRDKSLDCAPMISSRSSSYKFPPYKPSSNERTIHYDKYGNYKGESWKRK